MSDTEREPCLGLDIGTSRIVLARRVQGKPDFQAQLNAFVTIPFSKMTHKVLKREGVPHKVRIPEIIIYGNESPRFAELFHLETRRPMRHGVLNPGERENLDLLRQIVASLLGGEGKGGGKLCYSLPAPRLDGSEEIQYHDAALRQVLGESGLELRSIDEGLAVVYGELEASNYTGIGVSCGGGMCNVCLAYLSVPVISFSIPTGGDLVDGRAAQATGEVATRVRLIKERSFALNGRPSDQLHRALTVYYEDLIRTLLTAMRQAFSDTSRLPRLDRPVPLMLSGGSVLPEGFRERFEAALRKGEFPVPVSEVMQSADPLHSTAKGALMAALTDM
ncbi:MAG: hypothetical protein FJW34_17185 [Acidobacteria bacterium]|nr:hypothetical protein [Acidobacteriota bacterium]